jgi:hypothetical protein
MLSRRSGRRFARTAQFGESIGCRCRSRRWAGDWPDSHAQDFECFRRESDALCAGFGRTRQYHPHRWLVGLLALESKGYEHEITFLKGKKKTASELMPRVHRVISLLKRWLMGTHQGAVSHKHLDYYLDEFTFRFNRRRSKSRGKLFFRLAQQALTVDPVSRYRVVHPKLGKAESKTR